MEGPSLVILREEVKKFTGKKVYLAEGNTKIDKSQILNKKVLEFLSWGKHFLIVFDGFYLRIHFLMFGSYRINETKENRTPILSLVFKSGELNFYSSALKLIEGHPSLHYDWSVDLMDSSWDEGLVYKKCLERKSILVSDLLLDQDVFAGSGNIIKNEVLYRLHIHPESVYSKLTLKLWKALVTETRNYSFDFYKWKKAYMLKKHWLIYKKRICRRCELPSSIAYTGKLQRISYFCTNCQKLYT